MIRVIVACLFLSGCALRINDEYPKVGEPYQKIFLTHMWSV